jgi:hypothetical protein
LLLVGDFDDSDLNVHDPGPLVLRNYESDLPDDEEVHLADNTAFFDETLPGRDAPLDSPGGADGIGRVGVDTPYVASLPSAR